MFQTTRADPGAGNMSEDEEASLVQERDRTLRTALDQIQQRRRAPPHTPQSALFCSCSRTPPSPPQGPLEALRQREWLLNLQEQQELQSLKVALSSPVQQELTLEEKEEQLLFNGEVPLLLPVQSSAPATCTTTTVAVGGQERRPQGTENPTQQMPQATNERGRANSPKKTTELPSWQQKAMPLSVQDEAAMLAQAIELSHLDDGADSKVEEEQLRIVLEESRQEAQRRRGGGGNHRRGASRFGRRGWGGPGRGGGSAEASPTSFADAATASAPQTSSTASPSWAA
ncbi:hypothetical protein MTO96_015216 [Rhipicephalus appendiculatus]